MTSTPTAPRTFRRSWTSFAGTIPVEPDLQAIATSGGDVFTFGQFETQTTFRGDAAARDGNGLVLSKRDGKTGAVLWSRRLGGTSARPYALAAQRSVIVAGSFEGVADFGGGAITRDGWATFLASYDAATGAHLWSREIGSDCASQLTEGPVYRGRVSSIIASARVFVAGACTDETPRAEQEDGPLAAPFASSYDANDGTSVWNRAFDGDTDSADAYLIAVDDSDVVVAGTFVGELTLDRTYNSSQTYHDIFVTRLSGQTGAPIWSRSLSGPGDDRAAALATVDGDVAITGIFNDRIVIGSHTARSEGRAVFLARMRATDGSTQWARTVGNEVDRSPSGLAVMGDMIVLGGMPPHDGPGFLASFDARRGGPRRSARLAAETSKWVHSLASLGDRVALIENGCTSGCTPGDPRPRAYVSVYR